MARARVRVGVPVRIRVRVWVRVRVRVRVTPRGDHRDERRVEAEQRALCARVRVDAQVARRGGDRGELVAERDGLRLLALLELHLPLGVGRPAGERPVDDGARVAVVGARAEDDRGAGEG